MYHSNLILKAIHSPDLITSISHVNELIEDEQCLTLIEKPFFELIEPIIKMICQEQVLGDIVFVGVFKGGSALYLNARFRELGFKGNCWVFDSFKGFNHANLANKKDREILEKISPNTMFEKKGSAAAIQQLFQKFELDDNLKIVSGYIEETLVPDGLEKISFLHIDVDCFEPTLIALEKLYPLVENRGWVIIDDYHATVFSCKEATDLFRINHHIEEHMESFGTCPVGWQKTTKFS